jgi:nitric oxide reductase NorD protein
MSPRRRAQLQVIETEPDRAVTRLHHLIRHRDALRARFRDCWAVISVDAADADLDRWAEGSLELAFVNAGPECQFAFWRLSVDLRSELTLNGLADFAHAAADICRGAGAQAALACLQALPAAQRRLPSVGDIALWSRGLIRMAREAPESVVAVASRTDIILQACDVSGFETFIATGLKYTRSDRVRRRAFFTLEDRLATQALEQAAGALTFSRDERVLKAYATALWGRPPVLRSAVAPPGGQLARRVNIAGGVVRVPPVFRGVQKNSLPQLFRACVAHATAHVALTRTRFPIGSLKPLQMALIGLVEDARVEALAMRSFPGLRGLWAPFHVAEPTGVITAPTLMARLARALFDRDYADPDGFVSKGRVLFAAELHRLDDVSLSRQIGGLLGNDIGQMRVQFNARTYAVEPVYRDDGLGLWDFGDRAQPQDDVVELMVDAARIERRDEADNPDRHREEAEPTPNAVGRARERTPDERGPVLATYPEWDCDAATERPDWTTVRAATVWQGDAGAIDSALDNIPAVRARVRRLVSGAKVGRHERLKRRSDGPELDLDAALDAAIALRADDMPDERVFRTMMRRKRDLAVTILMDVSESTRDRVVAAGASVLDLERLAVATLAEALAALGDPFAVRAFASAGREDVRMFCLKEFDEPYGANVKARLAHLEPHLSTRLGTALRHTGAEIVAVRSHRKLILVLTDGEPSDVDVVDPRDLVEDARRAVLSLRSRGIDVFGVTLDPSGAGSGAAVFGRGQHMPVRRLEDLPARLAELYFRLARR